MDDDTFELQQLQSHKPREYQRFIFNIAKTTNTIVVLPTGTGKTLISLLLIKHMADIDFGNALVDDEYQSSWHHKQRLFFSKQTI
ncbi:hypothetical protein BDR26DRAFT_23471 [Obelidium mucronatum]|nr:hypothetical protein BDR26DRAFT_23471 [Obelidium mucronatum]